ncbi:hypothetical protein D3C72_2072030 [compost metagenome]
MIYINQSVYSVLATIFITTGIIAKAPMYTAYSYQALPFLTDAVRAFIGAAFGSFPIVPKSKSCFNVLCTGGLVIGERPIGPKCFLVFTKVIRLMAITIAARPNATFQCR